MKKIILFITCVALTIGIMGCGEDNSKYIHRINKDTFIYYRKIESDLYMDDSLTIYETSEYIYDWYPKADEAYVSYKGEKLQFVEALRRNIITIEDLTEAGVDLAIRPNTDS